MNTDQVRPTGAPLVVIFEGKKMERDPRRALFIALDPARREYIVRNRWFGKFGRTRRIPAADVVEIIVERGFVMGSRPCWPGFLLRDGSKESFSRIGIPQELAEHLAADVAGKLALPLGPTADTPDHPDSSSPLSEILTYFLFHNTLGLGVGALAYWVLTAQAKPEERTGQLVTGLIFSAFSLLWIGSATFYCGKSWLERQRRLRKHDQ